MEPFNRLQEVTLRICPRLGEVVERMRRCGCEPVSMTGSGSAFFTPCASRKEANVIAEGLVREEIGDVFELSSNVPNDD